MVVTVGRRRLTSIDDRASTGTQQNKAALDYDDNVPRVALQYQTSALYTHKTYIHCAPPKKVDHATDGDNFVKTTDFLNKFSPLEREENCKQNPHNIVLSCRIECTELCL